MSHHELVCLIEVQQSPLQYKPSETPSVVPHVHHTQLQHEMWHKAPQYTS